MLATLLDTTNALVSKGDPLPDDPSQGVILPIDKPGGWTSFDVVRKLRGILGIRKIGHAGTLDPLATGLLICCAGRATKQVSSFVRLDKVYEGTLRLGEVTPSHDSETSVTERRAWEHVSDQDLTDSMAEFVGTIMQTPPMYSAVKVKGRRLYKSARKGIEVAREPREVSVGRFDFLERSEQDVRFRVSCSKGTYVRALVHDLGTRLGCGAHLVQLRRTAVGPFDVKDAWTLDELSDRVSSSKGERERSAQ